MEFMEFVKSYKGDNELPVIVYVHGYRLYGCIYNQELEITGDGQINGFINRVLDLGGYTIDIIDFAGGYLHFELLD